MVHKTKAKVEVFEKGKDVIVRYRMNGYYPLELILPKLPKKISEKGYKEYLEWVKKRGITPYGVRWIGFIPKKYFKGKPKALKKGREFGFVVEHEKPTKIKGTPFLIESER